MRRLSIHPKILGLSEDDFRAWWERTGLKGKWSDHYPKKKKTVKKVEEGGE